MKKTVITLVVALCLIAASATIAVAGKQDAHESQNIGEQDDDRHQDAGICGIRRRRSTPQVQRLRLVERPVQCSGR